MKCLWLHLGFMMATAFGQGVIATVAGTDSTFPTKPMPALDAPLGAVRDVACDTRGNLYIADFERHIIVKVDSRGVLSVFAGNGFPDWSGDGGAAINAALGRPSGIAIDAAGNVFVADSSNNRVRKISPAGFITTVAGNGSSQYSGDGGPATSAGMYPLSVAVDAVGNLFITDQLNHRVRMVTPAGIISTVAGVGSVIIGPPP
jgi:sugar lactone lactonase YvrE